MARDGWPTNGDLRSALLSRGWEFEFTQAVDLLERLVGHEWSLAQGETEVGNARQIGVGLNGPFGAERIRFAPSSKLAPTASQVQAISWTNQPHPPAAMIDGLLQPPLAQRDQLRHQPQVLLRHIDR